MLNVSTINQVKQNNVKLVKNSLKSITYGTKNNIANMTGLSVATCNTILNQLVETGEILPVDNDENSSVGRPPKYFRFNESFSNICCVYIPTNSATPKIHYTVTDLLGNFLIDGNEPSQDISLANIISCIKKLCEKFPKINTISLGVPGYYHNNKLSSSGRIALDGCDIIAELKNVFPFNIYVENDMNAMAYGIYYYRQDIVSPDENISLITMLKKDSLGSGSIIDGKILHGSTSFAGEVLHINYPEGDVKKLLSSGKEGVITVASRLVVTFSVIINPAVIVFTGDNIEKGYLDTIRKNASKYISDEHMPRLIYKSDFEKYYLQGLSAIALNPEGYCTN